jgi:hypothetical protein
MSSSHYSALDHRQEKGIILCWALQLHHLHQVCIRHFESLNEAVETATGRGLRSTLIELRELFCDVNKRQAQILTCWTSKTCPSTQLRTPDLLVGGGCMTGAMQS